jgi:cation/acetate symporter
MTTRGAVAGGLAGLFASVVLVVLSKTVWVAVFHFATAPFPYENPALFSMPSAFLFCWLFSVTDRSARAVRERAAFEAQFVQSEIGIALGAQDSAVSAATS